MNDAMREAAGAAFAAYNAMETTKRRHFDFLAMLETASQKWNLRPTPEQESMRKRLLADHDAQVQAFKARSAELRRGDPEAFDALWVYIGEINEALAPPVARKEH